MGSNNLSRSFSGVIQDSYGATTGGSLTKIGSGTLTLSHANTYTGGTTINKGVLVVKNVKGSATGPGPVQVNLGTLRGIGKIDGAVTVGTGSSSGAILVGADSSATPGILSPGILTINDALTFNPLSTYKCVLDRTSGKASLVSAFGVTIGNNVPFTFVDTGTGTLAKGTVFTVIKNTSANPIVGRFSNLAHGSTFTSNGTIFKARYNGGSGNDLILVVQ